MTLVEVQKAGISVIPHVDALICQGQHTGMVYDALGKQIFLITGVCAKLGGKRYSPLTEEEEQALRFDETAASDDYMSYDDWEAVRTVKFVAALKLMRRWSSLSSPVAFGRVPYDVNSIAAPPTEVAFVHMEKIR